MGITLLLSMLTIFLVVFFLIPRSLSLSIIDTNPVLISIIDKSVPFIDMTVEQHFNFSFEITLQRLQSTGVQKNSRSENARLFNESIFVKFFFRALSWLKTDFTRIFFSWKISELVLAVSFLRCNSMLSL